MAITLKCPKCRHVCRVNDFLAGKSGRCPNCRAVIRVPAEDATSPPAQIVEASAPASPAADGTSPPKDQWLLKTPGGETFGPISRAELDSWAAEGRVSQECRILHQGHGDWRPASFYLPHLQSPPPEPAAPEAKFAVEPTQLAGPFPTTTGHTFQRRKYPAFTAVMICYYVLAGLTALSFLVTCIAMIVSGSLTASGGRMSGRSTVVLLTTILTSLFTHAAIICTFIAGAQLIKVLLDVQANTQETAHHARNPRQ